MHLPQLALTKTELSLTVPITNSLAFMFTVLGEWWAEKKVISRGRSNGALYRFRLTPTDTWIGMGLALAGVALCVQSKS